MALRRFVKFIIPAGTIAVPHFKVNHFFSVHEKVRVSFRLRKSRKKKVILRVDITLNNNCFVYKSRRGVLSPKDSETENKVKLYCPGRCQGIHQNLTCQWAIWINIIKFDWLKLLLACFRNDINEQTFVIIYN